MENNEIKKVMALNKKKKYTEAIAFLGKVLTETPGDADAWTLLGEAYGRRYQSDKAIAAYREAVRLDPDNPENLASLAWGLYYHGFAKDAAEAFARLADHPDVWEMTGYWLIGRGMAERDVGNFETAMECFLLAARKSPGHLEKALRAAVDIDWRHPVSRELFRLARYRKPEAEFAIMTLLSMPWVFMSAEHRKRWVRNFTSAMDWLESENPHIDKPLPLWPLYYLGQLFHNNDVHPLRVRLSEFIQKNIDYEPRRATAAGSAAAPRKRIRLGICFMRTSDADGVTVASLSDFLKQIDNNRFEKVLFHPDHHAGRHNPGVSDAMRATVDSTIEFPVRNWKEFQRVFVRAETDVLVYENWGATLCCGYSRFAPVQCNFYDIQTSTGASCDDYSILTGKPEWLNEWKGHYREKLALLSNVLTWGTPNQAKRQKMTKTGIGLPAQSKMILSWHSINRWLPEDDAVLATLLRRTPEARLVFVDFPPNMTSDILRRWHNALPDIVNRMHILPYLPHAKLLGLMREADAVMAPPLSSGTISFGSAFSQKVPIAAMSGKHHGARLPIIAYETLGVDGLVAENAGEYVAIIERMMNDPEWRRAKGRELHSRLPRLYDTSQAVGEFQNFIEMAYARAMSGLAPAHWYGGEFHPDA